MQNNLHEVTATIPAETLNITSIELLRGLLDVPKPKDDEWQLNAGRAVSKIFVNFLHEPNDVIALRSVALLVMADSLGVKDARKQKIKLFRWKEYAPPQLSVLTRKDEQRSALDALSKLTTVWARKYAEQALADTSLSEEFVPYLLKWIRATFVDSPSFVQEFYANHISKVISGERLVVLLKDASKLLKPSKGVSAERVAENLAAIVKALSIVKKISASDDKIVSISLKLASELLKEQAAVMPAVLMQPSYITAFGHLLSLATKGTVFKQVTIIGDSLTFATISLILADLTHYGKQAASHWRTMVPILRAAYPNWNAFIDSATKISPALATINPENGEINLSNDVYAAEAVFARLLPAWDAFVAELSDSNRVVSLRTMLYQAAATNGVVALGAIDEVVNFDAFCHHLDATVPNLPSQVRIIRPGVCVRRTDGSERILVTALVAPV